MDRKIYAEICADEDHVIRNCETNGISDDGTISVLEHEFGWLEQSGFSLENAIISDSDEPDAWARYISYVMEWAFEHSSDEGCLPIKSYIEWRKAEGLSTKGLMLRKKIPLVAPSSVCVSLVNMLGEGSPTINGDRTTPYIKIATIMGRTAYVKAALIEESNDLPEDDKRYALHIINDIDKTDCRLMRTTSLDIKELELLLKEILNAMKEGRM